ncbi:MAG: hypothetical protein GC200_05200 [Tepidisphaera sp.]|nr:hypothetical protein [Tepidisphaera sp.]
MPYAITEFIDTPNPNALKCVLDRSPAPEGGMRSYARARPETSPPASDPLGAAIMAIPAIDSVLIHDGWITIVKRPDAAWASVKKAVAAALAAAPSPA